MADQTQVMRVTENNELVNLKPSIDIQAREAWLKKLSSKPEKTDKQGSAEGIPISYLENLLDEIYLGIWCTENFRYQVIANEIVGTIDLRVFDPTIQAWLTRSGSAAVMIRQNSGSAITDIGAKLKNALMLDMPKLETMCLKAAAKRLAKIFGRDLNRKHEDTYEEVYSHEIELNEIIEPLKNDLNACKNIDDLLKVWKVNEALHNNSAAKKLFNSAKLKLTYGQ